MNKTVVAATAAITLTVAAAAVRTLHKEKYTPDAEASTITRFGRSAVAYIQINVCKIYDK